MDVYGQGWWRFPQYDLVDGYITPTSTQLEWYYPDEADSDPPERRRLPSYLELSRVPDQDRDNHWSPLTEGESERIIQWSERYGPLGVLLSRTIEVELPQATVHRWTGTGWNARTVTRGADRDRIRSGSGPRVLLRDLSASYGEGRVREESLLENWWTFFPEMWGPGVTYLPHVRASQSPGWGQMPRSDWPEPGTERFRLMYRESIPEFMEAALAFRDGVEWATDARDPSIEPTGQWRALTQLNHFQAVGARVLMPVGAGRVGVKFTVPSLLNMLAVAYADHLAAGRAFGHCPLPTCGRMFLVTDRRNRYCSKRHNDAGRARTYRAKKRKGKGAGRVKKGGSDGSQ